MNTKPPSILIVNDDGIQAPGIKWLEEACKALTDHIWIVAPEIEQSSSSRAFTTKTPLRVREIGSRRFAVSGTPTDCVLLSLLDLMKNHPPDLVVSGINYGQNIAEDVQFSGTVAAAMQAMQFGYRSIAFSLTINLSGERKIHWETAKYYTPFIIRSLMELKSWPKNLLYNVNFPDCSIKEVRGIEFTQTGSRDHHMQHVDKRTDLRGQSYYWLGYSGKRSQPPKGVDLKVIYENKISITPLQSDLTNKKMLKQLHPITDRFNEIWKDKTCL